MPDDCEPRHWLNTRAKTSRQPFWRRERAMLRFCRRLSLQKSVAIHLFVQNLFAAERTLSSRDNFKANRIDALAEWRDLCAA